MVGTRGAGEPMGDGGCAGWTYGGFTLEELRLIGMVPGGFLNTSWGGRTGRAEELGGVDSGRWQVAG